MQLFPREKPKAKAVEQQAELQPLDPIALCLALWLGMIVCAFGLVRLMDDAAHRTETANHLAIPAQAVNPLAPGG